MARIRRKRKGIKKAATKKGRKKGRSRRRTSPSRKAKKKARTGSRRSGRAARGRGGAGQPAEQLIEGFKRIADSVGERIRDAVKLLPKWKENVKRESPRLRRIMKRVTTQAKRLQKKIRRFFE